MSDVPYLLPRKEIRLTRDEANQALEMGLVPLTVQNDQLVPIFPRRAMLGLLLDDYRVHLRRKLSNGRWSVDSPVENQLIVGYQALLAEYDARDDLSSISMAYRAAVSSAHELRVAFEADGRLFDDLPLRIAIEQNEAACKRHASTIEAARSTGTTIAGSAINDFVWHKWLDWLSESGVWQIVEFNGKSAEVYRIDKLSMANLTRLAHVFLTAAELADAVQDEVRRTTPAASPKGGRPIDYPMKWLIREARRQGMDVAALSKLIYERRNDLADFRGIGKTSLLKRLTAAWRRVPQSDPSLQTPTVAHNL